MPSPEGPGLDRPARLNALRLHGMAAARSEPLAGGPGRPMQPEARPDRPIEAERTDRRARGPRHQPNAARLPAHRDPTGIDWAEF